MRRRKAAIPPALRRVSLFRTGVMMCIVVTAVLAFTLQVGVFRFLLRGMLVVGAFALVGSYLWEWMIKRRAKARD
jgi:hypothetical protein